MTNSFGNPVYGMCNWRKHFGTLDRWTDKRVIGHGDDNSPILN